jgi:hypothetical protein
LPGRPLKTKVRSEVISRHRHAQPQCPLYPPINRPRELDAVEMNSPEFKNWYAGFVEAYKEGSTVQQSIDLRVMIGFDLNQKLSPAD